MKFGEKTEMRGLIIRNKSNYVIIRNNNIMHIIHIDNQIAPIIDLDEATDLLRTCDTLRYSEQEAHQEMGLSETPRRLIRKRCQYCSFEKFEDAFDNALDLQNVPGQMAKLVKCG